MYKQSDIDAIVNQQASYSKNIFTHTMFRIKDPVKSLEFYIKHLGFQLVDQRDFPEMKFSTFFLASLAEGETVPTDPALRRIWLHQHRTLIELTYNYDTELDDDFHYHSGNDEPRGFGHLGVSVPDIEKACAEFEAAGITFQKRLTDGKMSSIAFIKDPDGYWIEILRQE
jgi:lactoylglutathione lyase